jgi:hypothetical protein
MIAPVGFTQAGIAVACDICGWSDTITLASIQFGTNMDGTTNRHYIILTCGGTCGSVSTHPVGGGARPHMVQALFILRLMVAQSLTFAQAKAVVKAAANAVDGDGRFQLNAVTSQANLLLES